MGRERSASESPSFPGRDAKFNVNASAGFIEIYNVCKLPFVLTCVLLFNFCWSRAVWASVGAFVFLHSKESFLLLLSSAGYCEKLLWRHNHCGVIFVGSLPSLFTEFLSV